MKRLTITIVFFLLFVLVILISQNKITDLFISSIYGLTQKTLDSGFYRIEPYPVGDPVGNWDWQGQANGISYYPNTAIIYTVLSLVTGVPLNLLIFIPFGITFLIIAFLAFASKLLRNKLLILTYVFIQVFYLRITYTLTYHTLGYIFHILMLIVFYEKIYSKKQNSLFSLVLFFLVFDTSLTYYSASAWDLFFFAGVMFLFAILKFRKVNLKEANQKIGSIFGLSLFVAVSYFFIDRQFYKYLAEHPITETLVNFATYIGNRLTGSAAPLLRERYSILTYDPLGRILSYFPLAMILFSITYVLASILTTIKSKKTSTTPIIFFTGLIACGFFENIAYFAHTQTIGNRYFQMFGLLIGFYVIDKLLHQKKQRKISKLLKIAAVIIPLLILSSAFYNVYCGVFRGNTAIRSEVPALCENASNWIATYASKGNIVSEHQISGFIFVDIIRANKSDTIRVFPLNEDIYTLYEAITQNNQQALSHLFTVRTYCTFVTLKIFNQKPMFGDIWGYAVPPLNGQENNLYNFTILNKVYDDGTAEIFNYNK